MRSLAGLVMALLIAGAAAQAQGIALGAEPVDAAAPLALAEASGTLMSRAQVGNQRNSKIKIKTGH